MVENWQKVIRDGSNGEIVNHKDSDDKKLRIHGEQMKNVSEWTGKP